MYIDSMVVMGLCFQMQEGSGAFGARVLSVMCWRTDRWVRPTERAGSEEGVYAAFGGENRTTALAGDGNAPLFPLRGTSPGGGSSSGAMLCDTCEIIAFRSFIMPPLLWRHRNWICFVGKRSDLKIQRHASPWRKVARWHQRSTFPTGVFLLPTGSL